ncbi:MAG: hypothetical protein WBE26_20605 [Phycisphaerae bacterium]
MSALARGTRANGARDNEGEATDARGGAVTDLPAREGLRDSPIEAARVRVVARVERERVVERGWPTRVRGLILAFATRVEPRDLDRTAELRAVDRRDRLGAARTIELRGTERLARTAVLRDRVRLGDPANDSLAATDNTPTNATTSQNRRLFVRLMTVLLSAWAQNNRNV